jgi:SET domain-containing protein
MEPIHKSLEIKESPIHGLGVFAKEDIPINTRLAIFTGDRYSYKDFYAKYGNDRSYCYIARRGNYILCAKEKRNVITYINEAKEPNVFLYRFKLRTIRDIKKGEELFLRYFEKYPRDYELK